MIAGVAWQMAHSRMSSSSVRSLSIGVGFMSSSYQSRGGASRSGAVSAADGFVIIGADFKIAVMNRADVEGSEDRECIGIAVG